MTLPSWINDIFEFEDREYSSSEWASVVTKQFKGNINAIRVTPFIPEPKRFLLTGQAHFIMTLPRFARQLLLNSTTPGELNQYYALRLISGSLSNENFHKFFGPPENAMIEAREQITKLIHIIEGSRIFTIRNDTAEKLAQTKLNSDIPASFLRTPENGIIYIELGDKKPAVPELYLQDVDVQDETRGLEGFYLSEHELTPDELASPITAEGDTPVEVMQKIFGYKGFSGIRRLNFNFEGCVDNTEEDPTDTPYMFVSLHLPIFEDADVSLEEILEKHLDWWHNDKNVLLAPEIQKSIRSERIVKKQLVNYAALALLYITNSSYREEFKDLAEARKRIAAAGAKKKKNAIKKSITAVDRIYVSPVSTKTTNPSDTTGKKRAFHIRMGHMRLQAYGEGRKLRKVKWIEPMAINAEGGEPQPSKNRKF